MLTYEYNEIVKLDGKIIGHIKSKENGFAYFPKGSKTSGEVFSSVDKVKRSLES